MPCALGPLSSTSSLSPRSISNCILIPLLRYIKNLKCIMSRLELVLFICPLSLKVYPMHLNLHPGTCKGSLVVLLDDISSIITQLYLLNISQTDPINSYTSTTLAQDDLLAHKLILPNPLFNFPDLTTLEFTSVSF